MLYLNETKTKIPEFNEMKTELEIILKSKSIYNYLSSSLEL